MKLQIIQNNLENNCGEKELFINNVYVGNYLASTYNNWYLNKIQQGMRSIPNIGKYVNGLIYKKTGIEITTNDDVLKICRLLSVNSIGEWFENYMRTNND